MKDYVVAFFGQRYVEYPIEMKIKLKNIVDSLLETHEAVEFLFTNSGEFDRLAAITVQESKRRNFWMRLILPYPSVEFFSFKRSSSKFKEIFTFTDYIDGDIKNAVLKRNKYMAEKADLILCFIEHPAPIPEYIRCKNTINLAIIDLF